MNHLLKKSALLAVMLTAASSAQAALIARWTPISGPTYDSDTDTPEASAFDPAVVVSNLDRVGTEAQGGNTNAGPVFPGRATTSGNFTNYTEFTITPTDGFQVDYNFLTYDVASYGGMNNASGYTLIVRTSLDGFAADVATSTLTNATTGQFNVNLSALQDISAATTFRLYIFDNDGGTNWADLQGSDTVTTLGLIVDGTVSVVPEPSAALLGGLGLLGLLRRRRA